MTAVFRLIACICVVADSVIGLLSVENHGLVGSRQFPLNEVAFSSLDSSQAPELGDPICTSPDAFQIAIEQLRVRVESVELRILTSFTKVVVGGEQEVSAIGEILTVLEHVRVQIAGCEAQRQESLRDVELYRRELAELEDIARADSEVYNWSALSLLGERSLLLRSGMSAHEASELIVHSDVHRAAEMHFSVARAAKQLASCEQLRISAGVHSTWDQPPEAGVEDACSASRGVLLRMYQIAFSHISTLLEMALTISVDDVCWFTIFETYSERRAPLDRRVEEARRQICDGAHEGESVRLEAQLVQTSMSSVWEAFTVSCEDATWQRYVTAIRSLVEMAASQPAIPRALCTNVTSSYASRASLLDMGALRTPRNSRLEELEQYVASARRARHSGGKVLPS